MISIQNIYKCLFYTPNDNLNKTCLDNKRCDIYYDVICPYYFEVSNEYKKKQRGN